MANGYEVGAEVEVLVWPAAPTRGWARTRIVAGPFHRHGSVSWDVDARVAGLYRFEDEMRPLPAASEASHG